MAQTIRQPNIPQENRVKEALQLLSGPEGKYQVDNPSVKQNDIHSLEFRKKHYESVIAAFTKRKGLTREETKSLLYAEHALRVTKAKINPTVWNFIVYRSQFNKVINFLLGQRKTFGAHDKLFSQQEEKAVVDYNVANIMAKLKEMKFGPTLEADVRKAISLGMDNFSFRTTEPDAPRKSYVVHFKKIPDTKAYYIEQFDQFTHPTRAGVIVRDEFTKKVTYPVYGEITFNRQEAEFMANGRPVMRKINGQKLWFTDDPKMQKVTFDVEKELSRWPIHELRNSHRRDDVIEGLQEGRRKEVSINLPDGQQITAFVHVAPDLSGLIFKNKDGEIINVPEKLKVPSPHTQRLIQKARQINNHRPTITRNFKKRVS